MTDKIFEDIYRKIKGKWWGIIIVIFAVIFVILFSVWNSLPDSTKEKLLDFIELKNTTIEDRIISVLMYKQQYLPQTTIYGGDGKGCDSWVTEELEPGILNIDLGNGTLSYTYESHRRRGWGDCHGTVWDNIPDGDFVGKVSADIKIIDKMKISLSNFSDTTDYLNPSIKGSELINHLKKLDGSIIK